MEISQNSESGFRAVAILILDFGSHLELGSCFLDLGSFPLEIWDFNSE